MSVLTKRLRRVSLIAAATCLLISPFPASAADGTTTGIIAGLGLSAATGKTTLGSGAGTIEAGVLGAEAFQQAGAIVAGTVNRVAGSRIILAVGRDETVNLGVPSVVKNRIDAVTLLLNRVVASCLQPRSSTKHSQQGQARMGARLNPGSTSSLYSSDIVAALATDTTVSQITLSAEDRLLINAVLLNRSAAPLERATSWKAFNRNDTAGGNGQYRLVSEAALSGVGGSVAEKYDKLQSAADTLRGKTGCDTTEAKAALSDEDALVATLNASTDKSSMTLLGLAMQLEPFTTNDTLILRLAIEQIGGTSITREGVLYTLGFPNAATVSSGLVVSYRLVSAKTGQAELVGLVRCMAQPRNFKKVSEQIAGNDSDMICAYSAA